MIITKSNITSPQTDTIPRNALLKFLCYRLSNVSFYFSIPGFRCHVAVTVIKIQDTVSDTSGWFRGVMLPFCITFGQTKEWQMIARNFFLYISFLMGSNAPLFANILIRQGLHEIYEYSFSIHLYISFL